MFPPGRARLSTRPVATGSPTSIITIGMVEDVEFATLEWVAWYNHRRLLEPLGYVPPAEFEEAYYARQATPGGVAVLT